MRRAAANLGLTVVVGFGAAVLGGASGAVAQTASVAEAPPAAAASSAPGAAEAAMQALLTVCKPAAERQLPLEVVAGQSGYAKEDAPPTGLPIARAGAQSWRVPSSAGEVHLVSGEVPEPAQASACMVAVFGDPADGFEKAFDTRVTAADLKFERDPAQSFSSAAFHVEHYTAQRGYLSRNIMVIRPLTATADHPTLTVIAYRVDYSWLKSISH
jgi:hypothetical protein